MTFISLESQRREREWAWKRNNDWPPPPSEFGERHKSTGSRSWVTPKRISPKKSMSRHIIIKFVKTDNKEKKSWEQPERNNPLPGREQKLKHSRFFIWNHRGQKEWYNILKYWMKSTVHWESSIGRKCT